MPGLIQLMRPKHWSKNIFVFAALIFSQKLVGDKAEITTAVLSSLAGFLCFCMISSAMYIFNDIIDRKADREHPEKKHRPIACGKVSVGSGLILGVLLAVISVVSSYVLVEQVGYIIVFYLVMNLLYSFKLKNVMILDVIIISIGFVLRAIAGAVVIGVEISPWLIICTFSLCLFLGFGKRWSELVMLNKNGEAYRKTLASYTPELLGHMLNVTSSIAIISFLLYSMDDMTISRFGSYNLVFTTPLVLFCVFRFSALIQKGIYSGPVELITKDKAFQIGFILWSLACVAVIYAKYLNLDFGISY